MKPADHLSYFAEHPQIKKNKDIIVKANASDLFAHVEQWAIAKGLDNQNNRNAQALKVMEEVGETMAALARGKKEDIKDGIGDSIVTLIILAMQCGFTATECLNAAYNEIKNRNGKTVDGVFIKE
jgi:NTP pyrophosphatase (non-canonical NTP hydrolase)